MTSGHPITDEQRAIIARMWRQRHDPAVRWKKSEIARYCGLDRKTVVEYIDAAAESWFDYLAELRRQDGVDEMVDR